MNLPNFSQYGYDVLEVLQQNSQGGRNTYKALTKSGQPVVIKQFCFIKSKTWDGYKLIEREIEILRTLSCSGIPRCLDTFDSEEGLCLVQEYIQAAPLSASRCFTREDIKRIGMQLLEILVSLQELVPPIFHRDIKPDNILVDEQKRVYLIDFGLARNGDRTMALSSIFGGTFGFMPPEQIAGQKLTCASDLYGVGVTLVCLSAQVQPGEIGRLMDFRQNRLVFEERVAGFSPPFVEWLKTMLEPDPSDRYSSAKEALVALRAINVERTPQVELSCNELVITARRSGEAIGWVTVKNTVSDTVLRGSWAVRPHPSDPPHTPDGHLWIWITPRQFRGNEVECCFKVDTKKLEHGQTCHREVELTSNGLPEKICLKLTVKQANLQSRVVLPPYGLVITINLLLYFVIFCWLLGELTVDARGEGITYVLSQQLLGGVIGWLASVGFADDGFHDLHKHLSLFLGALIGVTVGGVAGVFLCFFALPYLELFSPPHMIMTALWTVVTAGYSTIQFHHKVDSMISAKLDLKIQKHNIVLLSAQLFVATLLSITLLVTQSYWPLIGWAYAVGCVFKGLISPLLSWRKTRKQVVCNGSEERLLRK